VFILSYMIKTVIGLPATTDAVATEAAPVDPVALTAFSFFSYADPAYFMHVLVSKSST